ncbi:MAG: prolyl oligopeptidase family serine peptidase [Planctomycetaceae bacterium]|jgi:predicted esterase|nr:prolyl oligopeptidase family serine peptidase [Planctomycetaceae bacterium]
MSNKTDNNIVTKNESVADKKFFVSDYFFFFLILLCCFVLVVLIFIPPANVYSLSYTFWYLDFRYWSDWVSWCCWSVFGWSVVSTFVAIFLPPNEGRHFLYRRSFYQTLIFFFCLVTIWAIWYKFATLPLSNFFAPIIISITIITIFLVFFITWRTIIQSKKNKTTIIALLAIIPLLLGATNTTEIPPPQKVSTSTGIYDIKSKDELDKFTAKEIRELVKIENKRTGIRDWQTPHPVLVYCFEERTFRFTAGKYKDAEIKYRLHVPKKIDPNKKYPLAIHLHGIGEAGNGTTMSLVHLHSILPLLVGPEQQDFFLLVTQCPKNDSTWTFRQNGDGNLDVAYAALKQVINENPIDESKLSLFGLSGGGYGAWIFLNKYPEIFAAVVTTSCSPSEIFYPAKLRYTPIWSFGNANDAAINTANIEQADKLLNNAGGYFKMVILDQKGHSAWRNAMDDYNCFSWMISQQRGNYFNPPPKRGIFTYRSMKNCFYSFLLPLLIAGGLLAYKEIYVTKFLRNQFTKRFYSMQKNKITIENKLKTESDNKTTEKLKTNINVTKNTATAKKEPNSENIKSVNKIIVTENIPLDQFRIWHDVSGTKRIEFKVISVSGNWAEVESRNGKKGKLNISQIYPPEQELLRKYAESNKMSKSISTTPVAHK